MKQKGFCDSVFGLDRDHQEKVAGIIMWMAGLSVAAYLTYVIFFAPDPPEPKKIIAEAYSGPTGCPKERGKQVKLTKNGCFSPRTLIENGLDKGFRYYTGRRNNPDFLRAYRNDNDAIVVACYSKRFFNNGCFITGVEREVFTDRFKTD